MPECNTTRLIIVSIVLLTFSTSALALNQTAFLYSDSDSSNDLEVNIWECTNLMESLVDMFTGMETGGNCLRLFEKKDCDDSGDSFIEVVPSKRIDWGESGNWGFPVESVGPCRDPCDPEILAKEPADDEPWDVTVYGNGNFMGYSLPISIDKCTAISDSVARLMRSVKTSGTCILLFNNEKCQRDGGDADVVEIRLSSPSHTDIPRWVFERTQSVDRCRRQCVPKTSTIPTKNEVVLFTVRWYRGNHTKLRIDKCSNLEDSWNHTTIASVRATEKTCVALYNVKDCHGDSSLKVYGATSKTNFSGIRSVRVCDSGVKQERVGLSPEVYAVVITVPLLLIVGMGFLVVFIWRRYNRMKQLAAKLSEKEIREFRGGLGLVLSDGDKEYTIEILAQNEPFNVALEIPRDRINFDALVPIGSGEFGIVFKGLLKNDGHRRTGNDYQNNAFLATSPVAIKTVKPGSPVEQVRSLMKEVKVMMYVGHHPHIVQLIGCCTEKLEINDEIWLLLEYCEKGSLESFLKINAPFLNNCVVDGKLGPLVGRNDEYTNTDSIGSYFHTYQLIRWCIEIASAMDFLSTKKVIHGDLATRNVLINGRLQAKVSDFGLSKQLYQHSEYVKKRGGPLPWRWMALESLDGLHFSTKSDVWGYAITCWEIFTLGSKPYSTYSCTPEFTKALENGLRPPMPQYAPVECYSLMSRCWHNSALERPEFSEIVAKLSNLIRSSEYAVQVDYLSSEKLNYAAM